MAGLGPAILGRRALLLGAGAALAGCRRTPTWRPRNLPATPQVLADGGTSTLIGCAGPSLLDGDRPVPVRPSSGYGREATWVSLTTAGPTILGIGMIYGGAHSNSRWTIFSGDHTAVVEQEQPFDTFHGWGAGQLVCAVIAEQPLVVGSWASDTAGDEIAIWTRHGTRWEREPSTATPLASTRTALTQANAACGGTPAMVVGQVIELAPLRIRPAAWVRAPQGWRRIDLPSMDSRASAQSVAPWRGGWLVGGRADRKLTAWTVDARFRALPVELPASVGDTPVRLACDDAGSCVVAAGEGQAVRVLSGGPGSWRTDLVPGVAPLAATPSAVLVRQAEDSARVFELS